MSGAARPARRPNVLVFVTDQQRAGARSMYDGVPRLPGKSLVPLLTAAADSVQDAVLIENDEDYRGVSLRTLVTGAPSIPGTAATGTASCLI